jgi:hypothetical protein
VSTYTNSDNVERPFFLKRIARLLGDSMGLGGRGATSENTLLVDDTPYKNVLNNLYNAVHPVTFTYFSEKTTKKRPYLTYQLWSFLKGLKESGLLVQYIADNTASSDLGGYFQETRSMSVTKLLFQGIRGDSKSHILAPIFREHLTPM